MTIRDEVLGNFYIEVDPNQFILYETKKIDPNHPLSKGEEGEREHCVGYFSRLDNIVLRLIQIKMSRIDDTVTLSEFLELWENEQEKLKRIYGYLS